VERTMTDTKTPSSQPNELDDNICPICAERFKADDTCAMDIEIGPVHAECLDGCDVVDLDTGEPTDEPLSTFRYGEIIDSTSQKLSKGGQ
jgi:hypothetical protein